MAGISFQSARTSLVDPKAAADDLLSQLDNKTPKIVFLYIASCYDQRAMNIAMRERLPKDTRLIGTITNGEIDNFGFHTNTAVLGALSGEFEIGIGIGEKLSLNAVGAGATALEMACRDLGIQSKDLDSRHYVGIVIDDGEQFKKEELLLGMMEKNQDLMLVGGGAGDVSSPQSPGGIIQVDDKVTNDATLLVLFHTDLPWSIMRSHWYTPTGETLTITKIDESCTRALEIDHRPAAKRYAELIDVPIEELAFGTLNGIAAHPTALKVGSEYFMRTAWKPLEDGSLLFANLLQEGSELEIMKIGDPVQMTRQFFTEEIHKRVTMPQLALFFHCTGRVWYLHAAGKYEEMSATFKEAPPCAGFNANFEIYCGFHINTTLTSLVFGEKA